jgi:hypothetical protein
MNWRFWLRQDSSQPDTCASIEPLLSLFSDGMASPPEARRVESHLDECPECRRALEWMEATRLVIAKRPAAVPPADLRMRIAQAIAAEAAANTAFRPKPRSFVIRPAFAVAASMALVAVFGITYERTLKPNPITIAPPHESIVKVPNSPAPVPIANPAGSTPSQVSPPGGSRVAIVTPSKKHSPLLHPILVRPHYEPLVASLPSDSVGNVPHTALVPVVHSQSLPPRVKPAPVKQQVAFNTEKSALPHFTPVPKRHEPLKEATLPTDLPLRNNSDTMITPVGPSVEPDTTQVIQPEPSHVENVAVHTPSTDVLSIVHQHVLASLTAFKSDTKIVRDPNAHVQMAAYRSGGLNNNPQTPFVMATTVYTPTAYPNTPSSPSSK